MTESTNGADRLRPATYPRRPTFVSELFETCPVLVFFHVGWLAFDLSRFLLTRDRDVHAILYRHLREMPRRSSRHFDAETVRVIFQFKRCDIVEEADICLVKTSKHKRPTEELEDERPGNKLQKISSAFPIGRGGGGARSEIMEKGFASAT